MAQKIIVMSQKAIEFLIEVYEVPREKIAIIEHGVPDIKFNPEKSKEEFKLGSKKVVLTFGFIGRNKGIETVINALPDVIKRHPDVVYIILGKTHPNVLRHSGEEYRIYLMRLVKNLQLENQVLFLNQFVDVQDLFKYLAAADIYITPYLNESQITSGTLSYAVGLVLLFCQHPTGMLQNCWLTEEGGFSILEIQSNSLPPLMSFWIIPVSWIF